jgi:signal transduction histidine kinase
MQTKTTLILLFFLALKIPLSAQNFVEGIVAEADMPKPIVVDRHFRDTEISHKSVYFHDRTNTMTIQDIVEKKDIWVKLDSSLNLRLRPEGRYWMRFQVQNVDSVTLWHYHYFTSHEVDKTRLYRYYNGKIDSSELSGSSIPINQRPSLNREIAFYEPLMAHKVQTFYFLIESKTLPVETFAGFRSVINAKLLSDLNGEGFKFSLVTGIILTYGLFALFILVFFPIPLHFWYVIYVWGGIAYQFAATGLGGEYVWTDYLSFNKYSAETMAPFCVTGFLMMARLSLNIKAEHPWINRFILFTALLGVVFITVIFQLDYIPQNIFQNIAVVTAINGLICMLSVFCVAIYQLFIRKNTQSGWFILLFSVFITGICIVLSTELGLIPKSGYNEGRLIPLMIMFEVTFTSMYIIKNIYDNLLSKERAIIQAQTKHITEMERISADLHDEMGSTLSSISILSQVAMNDLPSDLDKKRFDVIGTRTREVMDNLSDIVWSVNPNNDTMAQLVERMKGFAVEVLEAQNIKLHFQVEDCIKDIALPIVQRKDIYLIFKEAVNNIAKHAQATEVSIEIGYKTPVFYLHIKDNGKGFDTPSVCGTGNGLKNMHKRAEKIGGVLEIKSTLNEGTSLKLNVPL